jgi:glycine dehydrogenase
MIPLGSCTMKLNATTEMEPITWPEFAGLHPFAPAEDTVGHARADHHPGGLARGDHRLRRGELQPNAGSQGEYAGLLAIRAYHLRARRRRPRHLPDPVQRARHQRGVGGDGRMRVVVVAAGRTATWTSTTCAPRSTSTAPSWPRS